MDVVSGDVLSLLSQQHSLKHSHTPEKPLKTPKTNTQNSKQEQEV